jgi:NAD(P)-dependent dehydrogenase (short-subunit alcohol dehydrogenase family)
MEENLTAGATVAGEPTTRVAVVTGGAAGIGQAYAQRLAADGRAVGIADLTTAPETERLITESGADAFSATCDVSDPDSVRAYADAVLGHFGRVDILVHNAGIYPMGPFDDLEWATWRRIMDINLDSLFHLSKAFLPGMKQSGWGRIVAMTSTVFHAGAPGMVAYSASKGGVIGFIRSLAAEVGEDGITVNAIAPSLVRTPGTSTGAHEELGLFEMVSSAQAIKRVEVPEDLVGAMSFLTSDDAAFVTGQTLVVDGGWVRV